MKIVVTGSLGNISKPLVIELLQKGHEVTVISSKTERKKSIEDLGAKAAIGSMSDVDFLSTVFKGADVAYLMEALPEGSFFDHSLDVVASVTHIGRCYKEAIELSGIKNIIHLSSIGGHAETGVGMLKMHYNVESILKQLPSDVSIKFMRPVGFYYNMFAFMHSIKSQHAIIQNYGGDEKEPWVSPLDIARVIAEETETPFDGRTIRYIASDELSPNEVAKILGAAVGRPDLSWLAISDEQFVNGMVAAGMNPHTAKGIADMNAGRRTGVMYEDYYKNRPILGRVKLTDFAKDFVSLFNK